MSGHQFSYVIVTPARDEARHIGATIRSVIGQTLRPSEWVIVDDGSTDGTSGIVRSYAGGHPWITLVERGDRGHRNAETGAVEAFFEGYSRLSVASWNFLVNLDADIELEPRYFERCFEEFRNDPGLGIGGGLLYHMENGAEVKETAPLFHVRGGTKIYRRACWDAIGGIRLESGWDTLDELRANCSGWKTRTFPGIRALHNRPTGAANGVLRDAVKNGRSEYFCGYHPFFMLAKCLRRALDRPYVLGAGALAWGFFGSWCGGRRRVDDPALIRYIQRQQICRLLRRQTIWR